MRVSIQPAIRTFGSRLGCSLASGIRRLATANTRLTSESGHYSAIAGAVRRAKAPGLIEVTIMTFPAVVRTGIRTADELFRDYVLMRAAIADSAVAPGLMPSVARLNISGKKPVRWLWRD